MLVFKSLITCEHGYMGMLLLLLLGFDTNYAHSIDLLKNRFVQPYKIINAHVEALLSLTKPTNTLASLKAFHDTTERYMRSLSALGKSSDSYSWKMLCLVHSEEAALEYFNHSYSVLSNAGFNLRSWSSNYIQL